MLIIVYKVQEEAALSIVANRSKYQGVSGFYSTMTFTSEAYIMQVSSILKVSHTIASSQLTNTSHELVMPQELTPRISIFAYIGITPSPLLKLSTILVLLRSTSKRIIFKRLSIISQIAIIIQEKGSMVFLQGHMIYSRELKQKLRNLFSIFKNNRKAELKRRDKSCFVLCLK